MNNADLIIMRLPGIDSGSLVEMLNVIEQSKNFQNPQNNNLPDNEFELSYANYIATGNKDFLDTYLSVLTEACYVEFSEWYEYITKHILEKEVQKQIGIDLKVSDTNWAEKFKESELIGWTYGMPSLDAFLDNIEKVDKLGKAMLKFFNEDRRSESAVSIVDQDYFESDHAQLVLDSVRDILMNRDMNALEEQANSDSIICMIEAYGWENRFNPILLGWICANRNRIKTWA